MKHSKFTLLLLAFLTFSIHDAFARIPASARVAMNQSKPKAPARAQPKKKLSYAHRMAITRAIILAIKKKKAEQAAKPARSSRPKGNSLATKLQNPYQKRMRAIAKRRGNARKIARARAEAHADPKAAAASSMVHEIADLADNIKSDHQGTAEFSSSAQAIQKKIIGFLNKAAKDGSFHSPQTQAKLKKYRAQYNRGMKNQQ